MLDNIRRQSHPCFGPARLWAALGLALLLPTTLWAGGHTIKVRPPNGVDDTANIQKALNEAVAKGPGTTVQLAAGKYLTQQLATYNFHGTFKGMGKDKTTIEALPNLLVNSPDGCNGETLPGGALNWPNGTTNRWPSLIIFVDGDIRVTDLSIKVTAAPGTATTLWYMCGSPCTFLIESLRFMGQHRTNAWVENVAFEGLPDDSPTSRGFNVINGVDFVGELPKGTADLDYYTLTGNFTVRNSSFKSTGSGAYVGGFVRDAKVTIGGSPITGNVFKDGWVGLDMEGAESSSFEISYNKSEGLWNSMWVIPWLDIVPTKPAYYSIHDNTFIASGPNFGAWFAPCAVLLSDDHQFPWIRATIYNNTVELKPDFLGGEGIGAYNTKGTVIWNNTITGAGTDAIGLWGSSQNTVIGNHVRDFFADPSYGLARIYLDPATSHNLVVCPNPLDTVLDQGTGNKVLGGWPQAKASGEAVTMKSHATAPFARPNLWKKKPVQFR